MFEKDGRRYFVVDGHTHFWDARPENRNKYGEGFIACFYDYHRNLSPEEYVWPKEKYDRYSEEDMVHDLFEIGYADKAIMQPTYLREFFPGGFNTTEQDAEMAAKHPDRFIVNGSFDPRDGEGGLDDLRRLKDAHGLRGV
jgi:predicted TIM-barrel fold metal-dependent hydrolase